MKLIGIRRNEEKTVIVVHPHPEKREQLHNRVSTCTEEAREKFIQEANKINDEFQDNCIGRFGAGAFNGVGCIGGIIGGSRVSRRNIDPEHHGWRRVHSAGYDGCGRHDTICRTAQWLLFGL